MDRRRPLREQERGEQVALLPGAERDDRRVVGRSLDAVVRAAIVVAAVAIRLQIGVVVLALVADEVLQREAVVRGDEIDARSRAAPGALEDVARAGEARGELADHARLAFPEGTDCVAVFVVPLDPARREVAELVAALAEVP